MDENIALAVEKNAMIREYKWLLEYEVHKVLSDLHSLLEEGCKSFSLLCNAEDECHVKLEKFILAGTNGMKCMVTLVGDIISEADVAIRLHKQQQLLYQTRIYPEVPWKLQQIQDAGNHMQEALYTIDAMQQMLNFSSGLQVVNILDEIMNSLKYGKDCLSVPPKKSTDNLVRNSSNRSFKPALPADVVANFYIQSQKLVLAIYYLQSSQPNRVEVLAHNSMECFVPWLNEILLLFTQSLQICQQLKDKFALFPRTEVNSSAHEMGDLNLLSSESYRPSVVHSVKNVQGSNSGNYFKEFKTKKQSTRFDLSSLDAHEVTQF